ncbi:MAG: type VI secretion system tip protein TssI/VgrG [Polyangiaceae bacterium]
MARSTYQLLIDEVTGPLQVHAVRGAETLSASWHFNLTVSGPDSEEVERVALGQRATLLFDFGEKQRAFYGVVRAVSVDEVHAVNRAIRWTIRIVPRLSLLKRRKRSRIFQNQSVPEIVTAVLAETGIATRWALVRSYAKREYCTQYEETDYDFVRRIMAEAGIYFYFFGGGPVDSAVLTASAAVGAVSAGAAALGVSVPGVSGPVADMASPLIPGDSIVGADDALCYPNVAGDDQAALAASTLIAMGGGAAEMLGDTAGALGGLVAGAATMLASQLVQSAAPTVPFDSGNLGDFATHERIVSFRIRNAVRSTGAVFRDYDPERPNVRLQSAAVSTAPFPPSPFEIAAAAAAAAENAASAVTALSPDLAPAVGEAAAIVDKVEDVVSAVAGAVGQKVPFERYEHHSPFLFPKWSLASDEAPLMLRQERRRASVAKGEGSCHDFSPGHRFELSGHHLDGTYVLVEVRHRSDEDGAHQRVYVNTFEAVPASMTYPPPRPKRRSVQVALTATVVGDAGDEIYTDKSGQVRVQFHWDREGTFTGQSSCWIRTMQTWSVAAWGHQFIPRVGMEVIVVFEGGDPDKPMVLGTVYNGTHPPTFALPTEKTKSGIRTQTTPGGNGYNELSFEDAKGREEIYFRAQRNLREEILNDQKTEVGANMHETVASDKTTTVGKNYHQVVGNDFHTFVTGVHYDSITRNRTSAVGGAYKLQVQEEMAIEVGTKKEPKTHSTFVHGNWTVGASDQTVLNATNTITLQCGDSLLIISPKEIRLVSESINLQAVKELTARGDGPGLRLGKEAEVTSKTIRLVSEKSSIELDQEAKIDGTKIKMNCKGAAPDVASGVYKIATKKLKATFTDEKFAPLAGKEYLAVAAGARFEGSTDGSGAIDLDVPEIADSASVTIFRDERPEGRQLKFEIRLNEVPPSNTVEGVKLRLENLGYYWGAANDVLDLVTKDAIRAFQLDHGLKQTGLPDEDTQKKLEELAKV